MPVPGAPSFCNFREEAGASQNGSSAFAEHEEDLKGTLKPGLLADIIVLDADILHMDPVKINTVEVDLTMLGGKVIYERHP